MMVLKVEKEAAREAFPPIPERANKGSMGRVLVVCGSYDPCGLAMCGAAYFCARAAYLCGAGIVEIFTPRENYSSLASLVPEAVFSLYGYDENCDDVTARLAGSLKKSDSVVLGCGLGKSDTSRKIVRAVLSSVSCPLVIDADGLNVLAEDERLWGLIDDAQRKMTVITPHPGEMSRLTGRSISEIIQNIPETAADFAREKGIICLLKDHNTAVSDGDVVYINQSGNSGMATAGMGDVLAGIIGSLLSRASKAALAGEREELLSLVASAAYLHGLAGDVSASKIGRYSLTASELLAKIPDAIGEIFG